ncbi:LOW QUALITY PROTEIN: hypothetical protein RJ639_036461 [Escallonia herrerae]|uniref:Galactinol--sucrose galactosyltransferase n=1 Tax=Escallonia herrerae TaxID=1293975 RepID=A0AA88WSG1_9ASTE|nr:LOW QUALITY PROTEIN: hypothetical protein RJ639_036461 [Escallonia herrerae]
MAERKKGEEYKIGLNHPQERFPGSSSSIFTAKSFAFSLVFDPSSLLLLLSSAMDNCLDLSDGKLYVKGVPLLSEVPLNVTLKTFSSVCQSSNAPLAILQRVQSMSNKVTGIFLAYSDSKPGGLPKWVGRSGSDLQMETQWVLLDVPETKSYVIIIPIVQGKFRSALHPGADGHDMCRKWFYQAVASSFDAIAYVHVSENPYNLMKEAYSALRIHLNTFRLLEEKSVAPLVDKFGWCTWDSFYLTVEPAGVWLGVKEFSDRDVSPRFLIIDDGWQSFNLDSDKLHEDAKNCVVW